jgi:hypothetical protein
MDPRERTSKAVQSRDSSAASVSTRERAARLVQCVG